MIVLLLIDSIIISIIIKEVKDWIIKGYNVKEAKDGNSVKWLRG